MGAAARSEKVKCDPLKERLVRPQADNGILREHEAALQARSAVALATLQVLKYQVASANVQGVVALPALLKQWASRLVPDRNYWSPTADVESWPRGHRVTDEDQPRGGRQLYLAADSIAVEIVIRPRQRHRRTCGGRWIDKR